MRSMCGLYVLERNLTKAWQYPSNHLPSRLLLTTLLSIIFSPSPRYGVGAQICQQVNWIKDIRTSSPSTDDATERRFLLRLPGI